MNSERMGLMFDKKLRELLFELHTELRHTNPVSSYDEEVLRHLEKTMKNMSQGNAYDKYDLQDQLETAVTQLESNHPALTSIMARTLTALRYA